MKEKNLRMNYKVLFVDDEENVLRAIKRQLRKKFNITTAQSGKEALELINSSKETFAVIITDMRMPKMNGIELLEEVKKVSPNTVRMMLTGNADQKTAIRAVNEGAIFRFLTKPCPAEVLEQVVKLGIKQFRLIMAEKELIEKTLSGSIKVLAEILSQVSPAAFSHSIRIKEYVEQIVRELKLPMAWQFPIAAELSQLGCVTLPGDILEKYYSGLDLDEEEQRMFNSHPEIGAKLLAHIPRFEAIAQMIRLQNKRFDEYESQAVTNKEKIIWLGGQILKATLDFDRLIFLQYSKFKALTEMEKREGEYNPNILRLLSNIKIRGMGLVPKKLYVTDFNIGMIINQDIHAKNGMLLASKGQEVTFTIKQRLLNFSKTIGVEQPIECLVPS